MKNFLRETKELIVSQGTIAIIAILQVSITAKILGPSKYGLIAIYIAITATAFRLLSSRNSDIVLLYTGEEKKINTNYFFKLESLLGIVSFSLTIFIFTDLSCLKTPKTTPKTPKVLKSSISLCICMISSSL